MVGWECGLEDDDGAGCDGWGCGGGGGVAAIHGDDVGVGGVGAEVADVVVAGEDVSEGVCFGEAVWVESG